MTITKRKISNARMRAAKLHSLHTGHEELKWSTRQFVTLVRHIGSCLRCNGVVALFDADNDWARGMIREGGV